VIEKVIDVALSAWNNSTRYWLPDNISHGLLISVLLVLFGVISGVVELTNQSSFADILQSALKSVWALATIGIFAIMSVLVHFTVGKPLNELLGPEKIKTALKNLVVFTALVTVLSVLSYEFLETNGIFYEIGIASWFSSNLYFLIDFSQAVISTLIVVGLWHIKTRIWPTHVATPSLSDVRFAASMGLFVVLVSTSVAILKLNF
jgi:hypothetical protein